MGPALTYAKYNTEEDAGYLVNLLVQNKIPYELTHEVNQLDNIYIGDALDQLFILKIPGEEFATVNTLLVAQAKEDFNSPGFTHYFDSFDVHELLEVLQNPNDWNVYDGEIARLLLHKRESSDPAAAASVEFTKLYTPEKIKTSWLIIAYIASFSILGVMIGSLINRSKKTLQNGASVYMYDETSRKHGVAMMVLGVIGSLLFFSRILNQ